MKIKPLPFGSTLLQMLAATAGLALFVVPTMAEEINAGPVPEVLDRLIARNKGFGGGVVRISGGQGVIWQGSAGLVAGPDSAPMTVDTPFEVASITKAVTAATILRLVEQGKLRLDSPLSDVLPPAEVQGFDRTITVSRLLSHTSGLADYWTDGPHDRSGNNAFLRAFLASPDRSWRPAEILALSRDIPTKSTGSRFHYSDTNYVLLGRIIEHVTGSSLHRAYRELIFEPLGMNSTWLTYQEGRRGAAPSHRFEGDEDLHNVARQSADWAGGGLVSTARDLERFLRGLASGKLFRDQRMLETMREAVPVEQDISYGLGLYRVQLDNGQGELWGHDGHGNSFAYYWPQRDITITGTLNQTENDWWPLAEAITEGGEPAALVEQSDKSFEAVLATGWDSLYMSRGVNSLRPDGGYGSGIMWASLDVAWGITDTDFLSLTVWQCFATQGPSYRELDASLFYTHLIDALELSLGYSFNYGVSEGNFYSNEIDAVIAYEFSLGPVTLRPSLDYCFSIGPDADNGFGFTKSGASFLTLRLDGAVPIYRDIVALAPWGAFGLNFEYNTKAAPDDEAEPFSGANHVECGIAVPIKINRVISLSAYVAYSRALADLYGTAPDTFWSGVNVGFSF